MTTKRPEEEKYDEIAGLKGLIIEMANAIRALRGHVAFKELLKRAEEGKPSQGIIDTSVYSKIESSCRTHNPNVGD